MDFLFPPMIHESHGIRREEYDLQPDTSLNHPKDTNPLKVLRGS